MYEQYGLPTIPNLMFWTLHNEVYNIVDVGAVNDYCRAHFTYTATQNKLEFQREGNIRIFRVMRRKVALNLKTFL